MEKKTSSITGSLFLLGAAFFWGATFAAQDTAADVMGPFSYLFGRSLVGCLFLAAIIPFFDKAHVATRRPTSKAEWKTLFFAGIVCGIVLFWGSYLQQFGIAYTTAGKASFVSAFYIILVPVAGILFFHKKPSKFLAGAILLALAGLYFLCMTGSFWFQKGDALVLASTLFYATHILVVGHFSSKVDNVRLSCLQFLFLTIVSFFAMLLFEHPTLEAFQAGLWPILFAGIFSSGVAYTCQILGQKRVEASVASVLMSMESVFGALSGWIVLGQAMSPRETFGCILVFCGVLLAQVPQKSRQRA